MQEKRLLSGDTIGSVSASRCRSDEDVAVAVAVVGATRLPAGGVRRVGSDRVEPRRRGGAAAADVAVAVDVAGVVALAVVACVSGDLTAAAEAPGRCGRAPRRLRPSSTPGRSPGTTAGPR